MLNYIFCIALRAKVRYTCHVKKYWLRSSGLGDLWQKMLLYGIPYRW